MPHTLTLPDSYSAYQISLLEDLLARSSPNDVEKAVVDLFAGCGALRSGFTDAPGSWAEKVMRGYLRRPHRRNVPDDGFYSEMAFGAHLVSALQIPEIGPVDANIIPAGAVPFSKLDHARPGDVCVFHENDPMFADYLVYREARDEAWGKVELFASADCSLYTDMPFCLQIANTYLNRLTAHDLQRSGRLHAPLCRWGDERSYEPFITDVPLAFIGLPKRSAVWIGTYGVSKSRENSAHFRRGLIAMLEWLEPQRVFVYGTMKRSVFQGLSGLESHPISCSTRIGRPGCIRRPPMGSGNSGLYASTSSEGRPLPDSYPEESFSIGRSLSAAAKNYSIRDPESGKLYKFAEGTTISDIETFAGKGTRNKLKESVASGLSERYGGKKKDWKHSKGIGTIDRGGRFQSAEVHWFENGGRKVGFKIKEWL